MNVRIGVLNRKFTIFEHESNGFINVQIAKKDIDDLLLYSTFNVNKENYNTVIYNEAMESACSEIDKVIYVRHNTKVSECQHDFVMIHDKKGCINCLGKFGRRMTLDFNDN